MLNNTIPLYYIFTIIGIIATLYCLMKISLHFIDFFFFHNSEKEERQMIHDLITDCADYKNETEGE